MCTYQLSRYTFIFFARYTSYTSHIIRCIAQSSLASASFRVRIPFSPEHTLVIIKNHTALMLDEHSPCSIKLFRTVCCGYLPMSRVVTLPCAFTLATAAFRTAVWYLDIRDGLPRPQYALYCPSLGRWKGCISSPSCYAFGLTAVVRRQPFSAFNYQGPCHIHGSYTSLLNPAEARKGEITSNMLADQTTASF